MQIKLQGLSSPNENEPQMSPVTSRSPITSSWKELSCPSFIPLYICFPFHRPGRPLLPQFLPWLHPRRSGAFVSSSTRRGSVVIPLHTCEKQLEERGHGNREACVRAALTARFTTGSASAQNPHK